MDNVNSPEFITAAVIVAAAVITYGLMKVFWQRIVDHCDDLFS